MQKRTGLEGLTATPQSCPMCNSIVPSGFASCRAVFDGACAIEYSDASFGAVHLLTVDAYALQHSEEHGRRSNAFHLLRLCCLLERGDNPGIGVRPPRAAGKALEGIYREFSELAPPPPLRRGRLTIAQIHDARNAEEHVQRVRAWAWSVWEAYRDHHAWARAMAEVILEFICSKGKSGA